MERQNITTFEEAVNYIYGIPKFTGKHSMEDTKEFLHALGDPDRKLNIIHIAGTNGKGSVCAYLRSILEAAGKKVAMFTSPHLVDVRERFVIDGEMISKESFLDAFHRVYEAVFDGKDTCDYHPTFFEYIFFMAMLLFAESDCDFCILETGLGGRLDATNTVAHKLLSVVTHISLDHVEYLGDTEEKIAAEKAGIFQSGAPAVFWDTSEEVSRVFWEKAASLGISAACVSKEDYAFLSFAHKSIDFSVCTRYYNDIRLCAKTAATYQMENAALAVRAAEILAHESEKPFTLTAEQIKTGVETCFWAGRMEEVRPEVYVDGAHNEDGVRAFLEAVAQDGHEGGRSLMFSVVADKDYEPMIDKMVRAELFDRFYLAHMKNGRAISGERLQACFERYPGLRLQVFETCEEALRTALSERKESERLYIAGSLYLVGEIKELLRDDQF